MDFPPGWDPSWKAVGSTSNTSFYLDHERIVLVLPNLGTHGTAAGARENLDFLRRWFAVHDDPPLVMVFFDRLASQDRAARKLYTEETSVPWALGFALVGGTLLGRAMASFFLGLARPAVPLQLFPTIAEPGVWLHDLRRGTPPP